MERSGSWVFGWFSFLEMKGNSVRTGGWLSTRIEVAHYLSCFFGCFLFGGGAGAFEGKEYLYKIVGGRG